MLAGVAFIAFKSWRTYTDAKSRQVKIDWAVKQLVRALEQTRSGNESDIIAGVQCLSTLSLPEILDSVLERLTALTVSGNESVAKHAVRAIMRLSRSSRFGA